MAGELLLEAYPLCWPVGQARTPTHERTPGQFKTLFVAARDELIHSIELLGGTDIVISTNMQTRLDGLPLANAREPADPGVAVYFWRKKQQVVIACDSYSRVKANLRAVGMTIEAMRTIQRHGATSLLDRAFTGFLALPPATQLEQAWPDVLGVPRTASSAEIKAARDRLAAQHHPDRGGSHEQMARINRAYDQAQEDIHGH